METRQQAQRHQYTIGWVSALPIELAAAEAMLDEKHETPPQNASDTNIYTLGRVGKHNVVIACLPDSQMGTKSAAVVATQMRSTFPTIVFTLMVGIGGGVPQATLDIRLGDVVVATNTGFQRTGFLNTPPTILLNAIARLKANHIGEQPSFRKDVSKLNRIDTFNREVAGPDYLFSADYDHISGDTCERCDRKMLVERTQRDQEAMIHYGTIASGNQVMRNALERDRISSELDGALCFDMEAAGLMNDFQCLVIRGISDYADSHKNKRWQGYAAGTAAAYAKELLAVLPTINNVSNLRKGLRKTTKKP
ncbi:nucleoside phosphorylase domain-containing protein [Aspergillus pseudotamarii]|uniref:Nucleoside phosphorylase domain-containing protein n=1 Tax=Aspergillus pseudotamarii TaxID=132259 RepID=A0A5N6TBN3_ASPPS|nr:nucleoside phosphorylase domain-containing protein [Aspergillus pseudotamarii]KAE8143784.1 nucleoside phosphorylase domain-containing protein [Aspergillus pseudotamarii]